MMFDIGIFLAIIGAIFCAYNGNTAGVIFCLYMHAYLHFVEYWKIFS